MNWWRNVGILMMGCAGSTFIPREALAACSVPIFEEANYSNGYFFNKPDAPFSNGWGRSGDNEYAARECVQSFIDDMWWAYDFDEGNWNDNRGFEAPCRMDKMLGRTLTALWLLNFSEPGSRATTWDDLSGNPLRWAGNYAHLSIDELDGVCSYSSPDGFTQYGPVIDNYTDIRKGAVYGHGIVGRASLILHEARHAGDWSGHDGNDGSPRCVEGGTGCDESFTWSTSSGRSNSYEVYFLNDFRRATNSTSWHLQMARDWGNYVIANRFDSVPSFRL